jgi:TRAP-type C4-dicarboxylate transport system substrate-binding protein
MKKSPLIRKALVLFVVVCLSMPVLAFGASDKTYTLKFQTNYPEMHFAVKSVMKPWIEEVKEASNGRLEIQFFPPRTIAKEKEQYMAVETGVLDITTNSHGRNPGKFHLYGVPEQPFMFPNSTVGSVVFWKLTQKYPEWQKEYPNTKLLFVWVGAPVQLMTVKKPVRTLEDLAGMKIIGWTPAMLAGPKALGANAVMIPPMDTYLALQRAMADGVHSPFATVLPFKLNETVNHATELNSMVTAFYGVISEKSFNSLPKDLQQVLIDSAGEGLSRRLGASLDKGAAIGRGALEKRGVEIVQLSDQERSRWVERTMPLREKWLSDMESKGMKNIREIMDTAVQLSKELSQ